MEEKDNPQSLQTEAATEDKDSPTLNREGQQESENTLYPKKRVLIILAVIAAMLLTVLVWRFLEPSDPATSTDSNITSYEECVAAGNPVMESFPEQCAASSGEVFVNEQADIDGTEVTTEAVFDSNTIAISHPSSWRVVEQESDEVPGRKSLTLSHPEHGIVALSNAGGIGYRCYYSDYGMEIESYDENGDLIEYEYQKPFTARYTLADKIGTQTADLSFNRYALDTSEATIVEGEDAINFSESLDLINDNYLAVGPDVGLLNSYEGMVELEIGEVYTHEYSPDSRCYPFEGPNAIFTSSGAYVNVKIAKFIVEDANGIGFFPQNNMPAEAMNDEIREILSSLYIR